MRSKEAIAWEQQRADQQAESGAEVMLWLLVFTAAGFVAGFLFRGWMS